MKSKDFVKKTMNSFFGPALCRLLSEKKYAIMMEYVLTALLIVAVAVVAISYFYNGITNVFAVLTQVVAAKPNNASAGLPLRLSVLC